MSTIDLDELTAEQQEVLEAAFDVDALERLLEEYDFEVIRSLVEKLDLEWPDKLVEEDDEPEEEEPIY